MVRRMGRWRGGEGGGHSVFLNFPVFLKTRILVKKEKYMRCGSMFVLFDIFVCMSNYSIYIVCPVCVCSVINCDDAM